MLGGMGLPAPVEYAVAVDRYLDQAPIGGASRRVYRISLAGWAWPLVGKPIPRGPRPARRGAAGACRSRCSMTRAPATGWPRSSRPGPRRRARAPPTASCPRCAAPSAGGGSRAGSGPTRPRACGTRHPDAPGAPLTGEQVDALFRLPASLREHALWRVLYDSGAPAAEVLALDADHLDLSLHRVRRLRSRRRARPAPGIEWRRGDEPGAALAAGRADVGTGVRHRAAGTGAGRRRRRVPGDRPGPDVLPARGGDLHRAHPARWIRRPGAGRCTSSARSAGRIS